MAVVMGGKPAVFPTLMLGYPGFKMAGDPCIKDSLVFIREYVNRISNQSCHMVQQDKVQEVPGQARDDREKR